MPAIKPTPKRPTHAQRTGKSKAASAYTPPGQLDAELVGRQTARRAEGRRAVQRRRAAQPAGEGTGSAETDASPAPGGRLLPSLPSLSGGGGVMATGSGIILGIVGYAILLNWIRGGPTQVRGWMVAKLTNKPYAGAKK